jgi:hypothetical protein
MTILSEVLSNFDNDALRNTPRKNDPGRVFSCSTIVILAADANKRQYAYRSQL